MKEKIGQVFMIFGSEQPFMKINTNSVPAFNVVDLEFGLLQYFQDDQYCFNVDKFEIIEKE